MTPLRTLVRGSTAELHSSVDRYFSEVLTCTNDGYASFLVKMARAILPLEQLLVSEGIAELFEDWPDRTRSADLLADLADLQRLPGVNFQPLHHPGFSEAHLFGILYVLEGSRLGGRVILSRLGRDQQSLPARFLAHGVGKPLWQSFVARLEASTAAQSSRADVVKGAEFAFGRFLDPEDRHGWRMQGGKGLMGEGVKSV